ncbi:DUF4377 domain-containing protein [Pseudomonas sp. F1_0610]|uniref:DUF4377 domain-containing protein n=1 Tax=Pseudomonas sp. F1_0610 TaxID=3114284 RepID=UPI0039C26271
MLKKNIVWPFVALALVACAQTPSKDVATTRVVYVQDKLVDCIGVGPMKCLKMRFEDEDEWFNSYSGIEGFSYQEGRAYKLKVTLKSESTPPADSSSLRYIFVEELAD